MALRIDFADFWPNFKKEDNYFYHLLNTKYDVIIDGKNPDLLFFSVDYDRRRERDRYADFPCKRVFFTGENVSANLNFPGSIEYPRYSIGKSDFAFTFEHTTDPRSYRLPLWAFIINWFDVENNLQRDPSYLIPINKLMNRNNNKKEKFCNFLFSNHTGKRGEILDIVSKYKKVDCAGGYKNNIGHRIKGRGDQKYKIDFISNYKFTIASENSLGNGYVTEKIIHPLSIGSIPIYWGSEFVKKDFNKKCFIYYDDYENKTEFLEKIILLDNNKEEYEKIMSEPIFINNKIPEFVKPHNVLKYFEEFIL